ncbi:lipase family protein [Veronia pacifica]|uniref:Lipase n=1 Tax=Veronia pacifica TaxID=1080227 RepID=A0A1C3EID5_9GAMM|nr:Mbeg1-like protein [Veronia pacifica]ODA32983.1 lipase [Veronia pacifica]
MKRLKRYQYEHYAILCRASYPKVFDHTEYGFDKHCRRDITDRFGNTIIRVLWGEKRDAVVVFKGSHCLSDWLTNLICLPKKLPTEHYAGHVHLGFYFQLHQRSQKAKNPYHTRYQRLSDNHLAEIAQASDVCHSEGDTVYHQIEACAKELRKLGKKMILTGHSSGGCMAVISAEMLEQKYPGIIKRIVTFGQPAPGFWSFKKHYQLKDKTYRICCDVDMVTFLPGLPFIYWHVGKMIWLHNNRIYQDIPSPVRIFRVLASWLMRPIAYHFMDKYIRRKDYFDHH